jgi:hypothetical protein
MEANVTFNGVPLVIIYDYHEGEEGTWDYPGSAAEVELEAVFPEDSETDILDIFTWNQQTELEDIILELKRDY